MVTVVDKDPAVGAKISRWKLEEEKGVHIPLPPKYSLVTKQER